MIINTTTVIIVLIIVATALYIGLHVIRKFALTIALENHQANLEMDSQEAAQRLKRERDAEAAAATAYAKVQQILPKDAMMILPTTKSSSSKAPESGSGNLQLPKDVIESTETSAAVAVATVAAAAGAAAGSSASDRV